MVLSVRVLALCVLSLLWSADCAAQFGNPRFSPDGEHLAFDHCRPKCQFVVHSLKTGKSIYFEAPKGESWINPSFGRGNNELAFVIVRGPAESQIATIRLDGKNLLRLTSSAVKKRSPNFSPDGKQIVFSGGTTTIVERRSLSDVDLHVVDLGTRIERRITDLRVRAVGSPFFMPDGERVVFHTIGSAFPRRMPREVALDAMFPDRTVFAQRPHESAELEPILQVPLIASSPQPIATGEIALLVRVNDLDGVKWPYIYDIFLAREGKAIRLTKFKSYVLSYGISNSGEVVAFVADVPGKERKQNRLMLWRKSTGVAVEMALPQASGISPRSP